MTNLPGDKMIGNLVKTKKLIAYNLTNPLFLQNRKDMKSKLGNYDSLKLCV